jgi:hypothetical protein
LPLTRGLALFGSALTVFGLSVTEGEDARRGSRAKSLFRRARNALLEGDRALGCPYGCVERRS